MVGTGKDAMEGVEEEILAEWKLVEVVQEDEKDSMSMFLGVTYCRQ